MDESKTIEVAKGKGKKKGSGGSGSTTKHKTSGKSQASSTSSSEKGKTTTKFELKVADHDNEDNPPEKIPEKQDHGPYEGNIWRCLVCGDYFGSNQELVNHTACHKGGLILMVNSSIGRVALEGAW